MSGLQASLLVVHHVSSHEPIVAVLYFIYVFSFVITKLLKGMGNYVYEDPEEQKEYEEWLAAHGDWTVIKCSIALLFLFICLTGIVYTYFCIT